MYDCSTPNSTDRIAKMFLDEMSISEISSHYSMEKWEVEECIRMCMSGQHNQVNRHFDDLAGGVE